MKKIKKPIVLTLTGCLLVGSIPFFGTEAATKTTTKYYRDACSYVVKDTKGFKTVTVNGKIQKSAKNKKSFSVSCSKAGKYTIKTVNKKGKKKNYVVYIDGTAPTISGVANEKTYTKTVKVKVKDNYKLKSVKLNGVVQKKTTISISKDGIYSIVAQDMAGNVKEVIFIIDKTTVTASPAPTISSVGSGAAIN